MSAHLSSFDLDQLAMHLLSPEKEQEARAHLETCARCKADFDTAAVSREKFTQEVLPRTMGAIRRRVEADGIVLGPRLGAAWRMRRFLLVLLPVSALAIVFLIARKPNRADEEADILAKGGPSIALFARRGDKVFSVHEGGSAERLQAGDAVRLVLQPGPSAFAIVGSVDGTGSATIWFPANAEASGAVLANQKNELPGSLVLDASAGPERVFALFSKNPIDAGELRAALKALGTRGPEAIRQAQSLQLQSAVDSEVTFLIEKAAP